MSKKEFTVIVYSDPAHAWGKVKKSVLRNIGIASKISHYSYQRGDYAYLEEDCDLSMLVATMRDVGTKVKFIEKHTDKDSRIRQYDKYQY